VNERLAHPDAVTRLQECVVLERADKLVLVVLPFFWMVYFVVSPHLFSTLTWMFEAAKATGSRQQLPPPEFDS
jgi:hypothetical protein